MVKIPLREWDLDLSNHWWKIWVPASQMNLAAEASMINNAYVDKHDLFYFLNKNNK